MYSHEYFYYSINSFYGFEPDELKSFIPSLSRCQHEQHFCAGTIPVSIQGNGKKPEEDHFPRPFPLLRFHGRLTDSREDCASRDQVARGGHQYRG